MKLYKIVAIAGIAILQGCGPVIYQISPSTSINDFVLLSTKQNAKTSVQFKLDNPILNGPISPVDDFGDVINPNLQYNINANYIINSMFNSWADTKFPIRNDSAADHISIHISRISIIEYCQDSDSKQVMVGLAGGEVNYKLGAKISAVIVVRKADGTNFDRSIQASADDLYVYGVGTGTPSSLLYKGENSKENKHAKNINSAINKLIMMTNSTLESIGY